MIEIYHEYNSIKSERGPLIHCGMCSVRNMKCTNTSTTLITLVHKIGAAAHDLACKP